MISKGRMIPAPGVNIVPSSDHRFQWSRVEEMPAMRYLLVRGSSTFIGDALKEAPGQHLKSGIGHRVLNFVYHGVQTVRSIGGPGHVHPQLKDISQPGRGELWLRFGGRQRAWVRPKFFDVGYPILEGFWTTSTIYGYQPTQIVVEDGTNDGYTINHNQFYFEILYALLMHNNDYVFFFWTCRFYTTDANIQCARIHIFDYKLTSTNTFRHT